ncbi:MAG: nucleotidyltransferase family protein [Rhodospirillaceae bacterium]|nr:nucleotidyltransferase family protein [Rhodospirillaceae bacterium]
MTVPVDTVMILAAGLGTRMRPLTDTLPKPLIMVAGKALIDWTLDAFVAAGTSKAVVNVHHHAPILCAHLKQRSKLSITISDETERLLETGGGIVKALPMLGPQPFFAANTDAFTVGASITAPARLLAVLDDKTDAVLLLHPIERTHGFDGPGDFFVEKDGRLRRRGNAASAPFVYAGIQLLRPEIFAHERIEPFSMNRIWTRLIGTGRLRGAVQDGDWFHVGTPEAIGQTEAKLAHLRLGLPSVSSRA